jgi:hypothetical protein
MLDPEQRRVLRGMALALDVWARKARSHPRLASSAPPRSCITKTAPELPCSPPKIPWGGPAFRQVQRDTMPG